MQSTLHCPESEKWMDQHEWAIFGSKKEDLHLSKGCIENSANPMNATRAEGVRSCVSRWVRVCDAREHSPSLSLSGRALWFGGVAVFYADSLWSGLPR
jgi:hypothetical protein